MRTIRRITVLAVAAAAAAVSGSAQAAPDPLGQHVSMCAQGLGARTGAPAVTCTHDGMTMTFANFGAMVEHMRAMH